MDARDELRGTLERSRLAELDELNRARRGGRRSSLVLAWMTGWLRPARRATAEPLPAVGPGEVGVSFAGHASVVLRYAETAVACDPMLRSRMGPVRRAVEPGLTPSELHDIDLILVSHGHAGHLDVPTLRRLPRGATVVVPPGCASKVDNLGFARVVELDVGHAVQHKGMEITATPVRHHGAARHAACAYVIRGDGPSIFYCGDSAYFSGFREIGERYKPDLAILPIGGYFPDGLRASHMSPIDALFAFEDLGARMLLPIHHGAFALSYESLDEPRRWLEELVAERKLEAYVTILAAGASRKFKFPRP